MKVKTLDDEVISWVIKGSVHIPPDLTRPRSNLHIRARNVIKNAYPTLLVVEEASVPIRRSSYQFFDFYITTVKICVEVHGQQHYKFNTLYHKSAQDFLNQKKLDANKKEWCEINNIKYVVFPFNEDDDQWMSRLLQS